MLQRPSARGLRACSAAALAIAAIAIVGVAPAGGTGAAKTKANAGRISSVRFDGSPKNPAIVIRGRNLGRRPKPVPAVSPSNQQLCTITIEGNAGRDYGTKLYLENTTGKWAAGRYRPLLLELDCIGLIVTKFTPSEVRYRFGGGYAQFYPQFALASGDAVRLAVNGATITVHVRYGGTVTA